MTRIMYDAADPAGIPRLSSYQGILIGYYLTGGPGQNWVGHVNDFPGAIMVPIDQASAPGAPAYNAVVQDVEPGAYAVGDVPGWTSKCTQPRPTVYCDRNDYPGVRAVWSGALWLAAPGVTVQPDPNVVAIQNVFNQNYDQSTVFDDTWPNLGEPEMLHGTLYANTDFVPFPAGSFKKVLVFQDFNHPPQTVRIAVHSASKGFTQILTHDVNTSSPETIVFAEHDADGVSFVSSSSAPIGWTLAP